MLDKFFRALASPLGIVLATDNPQRLVSKLNEIIQASTDPAFAELSVVVSPVEKNQIWLVNRGAIEDGTWKRKIQESNNEHGQGGPRLVDESPPKNGSGGGDQGIG